MPDRSKLNAGASHLVDNSSPKLRMSKPMAWAFGVMMVLLIFSCGLLARSYNNLVEAIQSERIDYVREISDQIISNQRFMQLGYTRDVANYANVLNTNDISSLSDVRKYFSSLDADSLLFASSDGHLMDIGGKNYFMTSNQLFRKLWYSQGEAVQLLASLSVERDCWLFAIQIDTIVIDGVMFDSLVLAIPAEVYRDNLAISLFGNRGASYIIQSDGAVQIKPAESNNLFSGYNLFSSIEFAGASKADVDKLREAGVNNESDNMLVEIGEEEWLFSYNAIDESTAIFVAVPLSITAAKTYSGLSATLISLAAIITLIALIAICLLAVLFSRDKERNRKIAAAEAKSDFFSKMSHDIRTPLNAIIGLQTLAQDCDNMPVMKEYLEKSGSAANYLLSIINDVLDMSRISSGKLSVVSESFDMNKLVDDTAVLAGAMAADKGVDFTHKIDREFRRDYVGDAVRIKQVLVNLLNNAVKYTPEGGSVLFGVSHETGANDTDDVTFIVADTGIGMSAEYMQRLYTPFEQEQSSFTSKATGSGLGLAIVHSLVEFMGGNIDVQSELGVGTTFTVRLPLRREKSRLRAPAQPKIEPTIFRGKRALLAEDNETNQMIVEKILQTKFEMFTEIAPNGEDAVRLMASSPVNYYDLILMDVKMPIMDGLEATRRIRALDRADAKTIPIIALSANAYTEDVQLSLAAGMNDHMSKPLDVAVLTETLVKYLKK